MAAEELLDLSGKLLKWDSNSVLVRSSFALARSTSRQTDTFDSGIQTALFQKKQQRAQEHATFMSSSMSHLTRQIRYMRQNKEMVSRDVTSGILPL